MTALAIVMSVAGPAGWLYAPPVDPKTFAEIFEKAKKNAEVVAEARVLTVVCTDVKKEGDKVRSLTLEVALQILAVEKGPVKKNQIVVVTRQLEIPLNPVFAAGVYWAEAIRQFPLTPGVKGDIALRWDKEGRAYVAVSGWVAKPNGAEIPKEVGKAISATESP
jgi:hypothetical protein